MILQALGEYYDRLILDQNSNIAQIGWEWKEIPFIIVLGKKVSSFNFLDTREGINKRGKPFLVPQSIKKSVNIAANFLWGSPDYIFGINDRRGDLKKNAFLERLQQELPDSEKKSTIIHFLETTEISVLEKKHHWNEIIRAMPNMSFRFDDDFDLYCGTPEVKNVINRRINNEEIDGICIVTGKRDKISRLHTSIKGIKGTQYKGADIVSFQKKSGYDSYNKEQGYNAPVGKKAMFSYTTALNFLLKYDSAQNIQIYEKKEKEIINVFSAVFWSERKTKFENDFSSIFIDQSKDDPEARTRTIKSIFDAARTGGYIDDSGNEKFYILGLSPAGSGYRISIRFFKIGTISEFVKNIHQHFIDLMIEKSDNEPMFYSLMWLLKNAAIQDKSENIPPNIANDFMQSILNGNPYPNTLLQLVIRRIKSDKPPIEGKFDKWGANKPVRIALIKAYINRYLRKYSNETEKELSMALDREQPSIGYQLGRLFAALEKIQEEANPDINSTIRVRYYGAACGSPTLVYPTLMRLANHHLAKLSKGRKKVFEILIGEIVGHVDRFPSHLDLLNQGRFAIGYYHQRQDLYTSKK